MRKPELTGTYFNVNKSRIEVWWGGLLLGWLTKQALNYSGDGALNALYKKLELDTYILPTSNRETIFPIKAKDIPTLLT